MTFPLKLITIAINIVILIVTIASPNETTVLSVIPIVLSTISFAFVNYSSYTSKRKCLAKILVVICTIFVSLYIILSFTCSLEFVEKNSNQHDSDVVETASVTQTSQDVNINDNYEWKFVFYDTVAYFGGTSFPYYVFEITVLLIIIVLTVVDICSDTREIKIAEARCFQDLLQEYN